MERFTLNYVGGEYNCGASRFEQRVCRECFRKRVERRMRGVADRARERLRALGGKAVD